MQVHSWPSMKLMSCTLPQTGPRVTWNPKSSLEAHMMRGFFTGHRRYAKDGHWIPDAGFLIGKQEHTHQKR